VRLITRTLVFVIVILSAFWFTAENAREIVSIDLAFLRVRASLPLVVFGSILAGMGLSFLIGWRAERRLEGRASHSRPRLLREPEPFGAEARELEELRSPGLDELDGELDDTRRSAEVELRSRDSELRSRDEPEPMEWR